MEILLIFGWYDGPIEGVLRFKDEAACWYFKLIAQRFEVSILDDRLFGLWGISDSDCSVLIREFDDADAGSHVWPVSGVPVSVGTERSAGNVDLVGLPPGQAAMTSAGTGQQLPQGPLGDSRGSCRR